MSLQIYRTKKNTLRSLLTQNILFMYHAEPTLIEHIVNLSHANDFLFSSVRKKNEVKSFDFF